MLDSKRRDELKAEAERIQKIVARQARRAFVLELTGTPKAGKTSTIGALESFFKQCGYRVSVIKERAAECPLPMKGHFFFNTWTTSSMIAEVLAAIDTPAELIILDRGFFDALVWLELQHARGQVTDAEKAAFTSFVMLDRWRVLTDLVALVHVDPSTAIQRENMNRILEREGSVMKPAALEMFNSALDDVAKLQAKAFKKIVRFDANKNDGVVPFAADLVSQILPEIEAWADPTIVAVPRAALKARLGEKKFSKDPAAAAELWQFLTDDMRIERRSKFEKDHDWVQIVACGMPVHNGEVFVFERNKRDQKTTDYGQQTVWKACHLEVSTTPTLDVAARCLLERIRTDLHLAIELKPESVGFAWDEPKEANHVGFLFRVPIDSDGIADSMREKEFRRGRAYTTTATFQRPKDLLSNLANFEPWSACYLQETVT